MHLDEVFGTEFAAAGLGQAAEHVVNLHFLLGIFVCVRGKLVDSHCVWQGLVAMGQLQPLAGADVVREEAGIANLAFIFIAVCAGQDEAVVREGLLAYRKRMVRRGIELTISFLFAAPAGVVQVIISRLAVVNEFAFSDLERGVV